METREIRTEAVGSLDVGQIWSSRREGIFVVVATSPARWRGDDRDVYSHIDTWYTIRSATPAEISVFEAAVAAKVARRNLRKQLHADTGNYVFDPLTRRLVSTMTRLDSYDDRWNPPPDIHLSEPEAAIEQGYTDALSALRSKP